MRHECLVDAIMRDRSRAFPMTLQAIATLTLEPTPLIEEGSWGHRSIGTHASTMTLYLDDGYYQIEWDIPALDTCEHIGLTFDSRKRLEDYDGVFSLPEAAIKLIRMAGFVVPHEFVGG
jgi:hypothetical protein